MRALGLPRLDYPMVGEVPLPTLVLLGGLLAGMLLALLVKPFIRWGARRARRRAEARMRRAVAEVGREQVIAPVRSVLRDYTAARDALRGAAGPDPVGPLPARAHGRSTSVGSAHGDATDPL